MPHIIPLLLQPSSFAGYAVILTTVSHILASTPGVLGWLAAGAAVVTGGVAIARDDGSSKAA